MRVINPTNKPPAGAAETAPQPPARFGFWRWLTSFLKHLFAR